MPDQPATCGQGLAENAALPLALAEVVAAIAENLTVHLTALDPTDETTKPEHTAYLRLADQHRDLAARLRATGQEMAGYRDLPMGRHDEAVITSPPLVRAFRTLVERESALLTLLTARQEQFRRMLDGR